jgi:hypothetical protein
MRRGRGDISRDLWGICMTTGLCYKSTQHREEDTITEAPHVSATKTTHTILALAPESGGPHVSGRGEETGPANGLRMAVVQRVRCIGWARNGPMVCCWTAIEKIWPWRSLLFLFSFYFFIFISI